MTRHRIATLLLLLAAFVVTTNATLTSYNASDFYNATGYNVSGILGNTNISDGTTFDWNESLAGYSTTVATVTYTYVDSTNNKAFQNNSYNNVVPPAWAEGLNGDLGYAPEVSASCYTNLSSQDGTRCFYKNPSGTNNYEPWQRYNFTINQSISSINWLQVKIRQNRNSSSATTELCSNIIANWTSNAWEKFNASDTSTPAVTNTKNYTTQAEIQAIINSTTNQLLLISQGNAMDPGEGCDVDYVEVMVGYNLSTYGVELWHNSTSTAGIPSDATINALNATIKFNATYAGTYSMLIYNWTGSSWYTCQSPTAVTANAWTQWWCNMTSGASDFRSTDSNKYIRIAINETSSHTTQAQLKEDYIQYWIDYTSNVRTLLVNWTMSSQINSTICIQGSPCEFYQDSVFYANATVTCSTNPPGLSCGFINGSIRANYSVATFLPSSTHKGFALNQSSDNNPFLATTEVTYSNVNASDDIREYSEVVISFSGGAYTFQRYTFNLSSFDTSKIFKIKYCHEGNGTVSGGSGTSQLRYYNVASATWTTDQGLSSTEAVRCKTFISGLSDLINNTDKTFQFTTYNYVYCASGGCSAKAHTDFVTFEVTYADTQLSPNISIIQGAGARPFYVTENNPYPCGSLSDGNSCQLNWTVNATMEVDSIWALDVNFTSNTTNNNPPENNTQTAYVRILPYNVTLNYPTNNTWNTSRNITHGYTPIITGGNFLNCTFFSNYSGTWGSVVGNSTPILNNSINNITFDYGADYNNTRWNVCCYSTIGSISRCSKTDFTLKIDATPPTYSNIGANNTTPQTGQDVKFYSQWYDNFGLSRYIFSWSAGGINCDTWVNDTSSTFQSGNWTNKTKTIPSNCSGTIGYRFYANDTANNWNFTDIYTINVGIVPTVSTDQATYSACGAVFYVAKFYNSTDGLISSYFTEKFINSSNQEVSSRSNLYPNNGTGIYLGNYQLELNATTGQWLAKIIEDTGIVGVKEFSVS